MQTKSFCEHSCSEWITKGIDYGSFLFYQWSAIFDEELLFADDAKMYSRISRANWYSPCRMT